MANYSDYQYEIYEAGQNYVRPRWPVDAPSMQQLAQKTLSEQVYSYVTGDAEIGDTARTNREALAKLQLLSRILTVPVPRDHTTTLFGTTMPAPIILAPIGLLKMIHPDGEIGAARAATELGLTFVHSTAAETSMEKVAEAVGDGSRWYQMYVPSDDRLAISLLDRAKASGYSLIMITLDTTTRAWRPSDLNLGHLPFLHGYGVANYFCDPVFRSLLDKSPEDDMRGALKVWRKVAADPNIDWERIKWIRSHTDLPIVLKGVLHYDDAKKAARMGIDGIVVSNHGGRQLDGAVASISVLPRIVDSVGDQLTVLFDSGIRSGSDAAKALAIGAKGVLLGRPWVWALGVGGQDAVSHILKCFLAEFDVSIGLIGHRKSSQLSRADLLTFDPLA
jgi:lactate 2-monooxygenase